MSTFSLVILLIFIFAFAISGLVKNMKIKTLDALLEVKNYDEVIRLCETRFSRRVLSSYISDTYILRAYWLKNDVAVFLNKLFRTINEAKIDTNKKDYLEIYYHLFIHKGDVENAKKVLDQIIELNDENFKKASQFAYDVACKQDSDYKAIEEDLELYKGFDLGVVVYNLGWSYYMLGDYDKASEYFYSCRSCFYEKHYYAKKAKEMYEQVSNILVEE